MMECMGKGKKGDKGLIKDGKEDKDMDMDDLP